MPHPAHLDAREVMTVHVNALAPAMPVRAAWLHLLELGVRHAPVVDGGRLLGIVSDRDLLLGTRRGKGGRLTFPAKTVADVMTAPAITGARNTTVADAAQLMVDEKIDALPIVGPRGALIGMVTSTDLLRLLIDLGPGRLLRFAFDLKNDR